MPTTLAPDPGRSARRRVGMACAHSRMPSLALPLLDAGEFAQNCYQRPFMLAVSGELTFAYGEELHQSNRGGSQ